MPTVGNTPTFPYLDTWDKTDIPCENYEERAEEACSKGPDGKPLEKGETWKKNCVGFLGQSPGMSHVGAAKAARRARGANPSELPEGISIPINRNAASTEFGRTYADETAKAARANECLEARKCTWGSYNDSKDKSTNSPKGCCPG